MTSASNKPCSDDISLKKGPAVVQIIEIIRCSGKMLITF